MVPVHGLLGVLLIAVAWPASWLQLKPIDGYAFFPLWLGYVLVIDAMVFHRKGTSLLARSPLAFLGMFLASVPLWWVFEGINRLTQNWHYLGTGEYSPFYYAAAASWHFSIVVPAIFETADLIGSFRVMDRFKQGPALKVSSKLLVSVMLLGLFSSVTLVFWPSYAFASTWLCLILVLDPINYLWGNPSILGWLRRGDWRLVVAFSLGALACGWFWEMWNYWAFPKWEYSIAFVDFAHIFEMPLLGYGGYLPFGLEVFVVYNFLCGLVKLTVKTRPLPASSRRVMPTFASSV